MNVSVRDWSNRPARPDEYDQEDIEVLQKASYILWNGNAAFTQDAKVFAAEHKLTSAIIPRVAMLHTRSDYNTTEWPHIVAEGELLRNTELVNDQGEVVVRWVRQSDGMLVFNTDPARVNPFVWARWIARECAVFNYRTVFLDYFSSYPWDYMANAPLSLGPRFDQAWRLWQHVARAELRSHGIGVVGNGRMAIESDYVDPDIIYVEKGGSLWWDPEEAARKARNSTKTVLWDETSGPRYNDIDAVSFSRGVAATGFNVSRVITLPGGGT